MYTWVHKASKKPVASNRSAQPPAAKKPMPAAMAPASKGMVISGKTFHPSTVMRMEEERAILASDGRCFYCVKKGHKEPLCPNRKDLKVSLSGQRGPLWPFLTQFKHLPALASIAM